VVITREESLARVEALAREKEALRRVATLAAGEFNASRLFDCVCEELGRVLGVETTDIIRFGHDGTATVVGAWATGKGPLFAVGMTVPVDGETVTAKMYRSERPQRVDDYGEIGGELAARLRSYRVISAVGAPITVAGRLWGGLMASSERAHAFPPGTEHRIAEFAELVTAALANADARDQLAASRARIVEAGYAERRRLGRDLHDGAQQAFVSAAVTLRLARRSVEDAPEEAAGLIDAAIEQVLEGLRDLRDLAAGIHPSVLTDRGLASALEALASRSPLAVEVEAVPAGRLPPSVETTAYFVVAEALTNAAKHAHCECARASVRLDDGTLIVAVSDDGVGGADAAQGSGLRGLADRVSALGGTLEVQSEADRGTTIMAWLAADAADATRPDGPAAPALPAARR